MITNARPMACGGCGNGLFRMFSNTKDEQEDGLQLYAECAHCKSVSIITVEKPQLKIDWAETGTQGVICDMTPTHNKVA